MAPCECRDWGSPGSSTDPPCALSRSSLALDKVSTSTLNPSPPASAGERESAGAAGHVLAGVVTKHGRIRRSRPARTMSRPNVDRSSAWALSEGRKSTSTYSTRSVTAAVIAELLSLLIGNGKISSLVGV
eukprot:258292-Rhodomonas_salina.1